MNGAALLVIVCLALVSLLMLFQNRRPVFSFLCIAGASGWAILTFFVIAFSGWGDGATGNAFVGREPLFYSPSICLLLYVLASIRPVPRRVEYWLVVGVTVSLLAISGLILMTVPGSILIVCAFPLYGISAFWPFLKKGSVRKDQGDRPF